MNCGLHLLGCAWLAGCATSPVARQTGEPQYGEPGYRRSLYSDPVSWDNGWDERAQLMLGQRDYRAGSLPDGDRQFVVGLEFAGAPHGSFLELEIGLWGTAQGSFGATWLDRVFGDPNPTELSPGIFQDETSTSSFEFSLGARKELGLFGGAFRPYLGAGFAGVEVRTYEIESGQFSDRSDGTLGLYAHTGFRFLFDGGVGSAGFDVRQFEGSNLDLGPLGQEVDGGYTQWAFSFSFFL